MQLRQVPSGSSRAVTPSEATSFSSSNDEGSRSFHTIPRNIGLSNEEVAYYEKRIAFIQKQHQKMLTALHHEVEQLKKKNQGT